MKWTKKQYIVNLIVLQIYNPFVLRAHVSLKFYMQIDFKLRMDALFKTSAFSVCKLGQYQ